jgi:hypothetical protein
MRRLWSTALLAVALPALGIASRYPGATFLMIFPDARTTALGGCGIALDGLDANAYYNSACLATGPRAAATWTHLPSSVGYNSNASYDFAGVAYRLGERLGFAANVIYAQAGETKVTNDSGRYIGKYRTFDLAPSLSAAYAVSPRLSVGATAKLVYSQLMPEWAWRYGYYFDPIPLGNAATVGLGAGVLYRPLNSLSLGVAIDNLGPDIRYDKYYVDPLPALFRVGFALSPPIPGPVEIALVGDVWRDLVTPIDYWGGGDSALMFWENMRDGLGLELRVTKLASLRLGYFEDIQDQTGGILVAEGYGTRRISLLRYLVEHHTKPRDVGWCWGVGVEFHGVKLDVGVDESIFNYATRDVRFQLSARL